MQEASGKKLGFEFPFRPRGCSKKPINDSKFLVIGLITVSGEAKLPYGFVDFTKNRRVRVP